MLVTNYDLMVKNVKRLLEVRHILVHEIPSGDVYDNEEVESLLASAHELCHALEELVAFRLYGDEPRDQAGMNESARRKRLTAEAEMTQVIHQIKARVSQLGATLSESVGDLDDAAKERQSADEWLSLLDQSQESWLNYRNMYCEFIAYLNRKGTIWPLAYSSVAAFMTKERTRELLRWLEEDRTFHLD